MQLTPVFPTPLHQKAADTVNDFFSRLPETDTVLVVNSCARGQAVPESDLDFAILARPDIEEDRLREMEAEWISFAATAPSVQQYRRSGPYAHLHLDVIAGHYQATQIIPSEPIDYFEVEIGNQVAYSAPMGAAGPHYLALQAKWLPFYQEDLRLERLEQVINACRYELDHIPHFVKRGLHFQAFDTLWKAFQEYLQALFIAHKTYPIAYNKWVKYQFEHILGLPEIYQALPAVISVHHLESDELIEKALMLAELLDTTIVARGLHP